MYVSRKNKKSIEYEPIWEGVKRCMCCGYAVAELSKAEEEKFKKDINWKYVPDTQNHNNYHQRFIKVQNQYGSNVILDYKILREKKENIPNVLNKIKANVYLSDFDSIIDTMKSIRKDCHSIEKWLDNCIVTSNKIVMGDCEAIKTKNASVLKSIPYIKKAKIDELYTRMSDMSMGYYELLNMIDVFNTNIRSKQEYKKIPEMTFAFNINARCEEISKMIQTLGKKKSNVENGIREFALAEYNKSIRLWDYCKSHPTLDDYIVLLWNTPKFVLEISKYLPEELVEYYTNKNKANRTLVDMDIDEAPYYFGNIEEKVYDKGVEVKDISYMDKLIDEGEIELDKDELKDLKSYEESEDYKTAVQSLMAMAKFANEKAKKKKK